MSVHTDSFYALFQGTLGRRKAFLLQPNTKVYIFPPRGSLWEPSKKDESLCDAFIMFVVSELEAYFEGILEKGLKSYEEVYDLHAIKHCGAAGDFKVKIKNKKLDLEKNHSASWSRLSSFFEFIGMKKEIHFPRDFWDDIETIVKHRGGLAHKGANLRIAEDRRSIIHKIEQTIRHLYLFDKQFSAWLLGMQGEITRLRSLNLSFSPTFE